MTTRATILAVGSALGAVVVAVLLYLFQPWALFTVTKVDDPLPVTTAAPSDPTAPSPHAAPTASAADLTAATAVGTFQSYEHRTTGTAQVLRLADGSLVLRLMNLATSNGPDVHVWLSAQSAGDAADAGTGRWLELGGLKGNRGNQNYLVPAGTDLASYRSVVIWCRRFSVAFGAAPLRP